MRLLHHQENVVFCNALAYFQIDSEFVRAESLADTLAKRRIV